MKRKRETQESDSGAQGQPRSWVCYINVSERDAAQTYTGKTSDFERRLKQHNDELAGDCRSTKRYRPWRVLMVITGFRSNAEVTQFEWALKHNRAPRCSGVENRIRTLLKVFRQPRATKKAPLFTEMQPLTVDVRMPRSEFLQHARLERMPTFAHGAAFSFLDKATK